MFYHETYDPYLKTLRRLPPDIVRSLATREFEMGSLDRCICGWAIQEALTYGLPMAKETQDVGTCARLRMIYGGGADEWYHIFLGVTYPDQLPLIEEAFARRLEELTR